MRAVAEYGSVVYHSSLTDEQDELIDRQQNQTLKWIFVPRISARKIHEIFGLKTLRSRRETLCNKFNAMMSSDPRFIHPFLVRTPQ